jgi:hypothetical protein
MILDKFNQFLLESPITIRGGAGKITGSSRGSGFNSSQSTIDVDYGSYTSCGVSVAATEHLDSFSPDGTDNWIGKSWP